MKRKSFEFLINGKKYLFFERNKEDSDYVAMSDRYRAQNLEFIQEHTENEDDRGMLLMKEMDKEYTVEKISLFLYTNSKQIKRQLWDSFKLNPNMNGDMDEDKFYELIKGQESVLFELLLKLENKLSLDKVEKKKPVKK